MRKRLLLLSEIALMIAFVGALLSPGVRADERNKKTVITFDEPVQVPGTVLPAGTYVFKLANSISDRNIVQIFNADETRLITTIMGVTDERNNPSDKSLVTFDERPSGQPEALQSWFYPGDDYGLEFVYPKEKATELAQANQRPVPSVPDEAREPAALKTAVVTRVAPAPLAPAAASANPVVTKVLSTTVVEVDELPQTASPTALIALVGVLCLAAAFTIRRLAPATK